MAYKYHASTSDVPGMEQSLRLMGTISTMTKRNWANGVAGHEALAGVKSAANVAQHAASYMMEVAHHAQHNATELDRARRALENYHC